MKKNDKNSTLKGIILFFVVALFSVTMANANNLQIGTPSVTGSSGAYSITFTIQWDNSWRVSTGPNNYDGVWVFVKYQDCSGDRIWYHADLDGTLGNHTVGGGVLKMSLPTDNKGIFIYRTADGQGNIASSTVTLKLGAGVTGTNNYQVHGMEMVYIPGNYGGSGGVSFQVGDPSIANATYFAFNDNLGTTSNPYTVSSENSLAANVLGAAANANNAAIPAAFPKGYNAYWIMKYEITQDQYVAFLNDLTYNQQVQRLTAVPNSVAGTTLYTRIANYSGLVISVPGTNNMIPAVTASDCFGASTDGNYDNINDCQTNGMHGLSWADFAAYLDWSCLRPMTELEYEKACRGTLPWQNGEYCWGDANIYAASMAASMSNVGMPTMVSSLSNNGLANYSVTAITGPWRAGMLAKSNTVRNNAATSYYGVAELSGSVSEFCLGVTTGNILSTFDAQHGDGALTNSTTYGFANVTNWPDNTTPTGVGLRGGNYSTTALFLRVGDRVTIKAYAAAYAARTAGQGGRGVRTQNSAQ